jgi:hypothetical protein
VANGVTTVLNLYGTPAFLALRERVARGETLGPAIYTSGPFISNARHANARRGRRQVVAQKRDGYADQIHGDFSREASQAVRIARREDIRVIGHLREIWESRHLKRSKTLSLTPRNFCTHTSFSNPRPRRRTRVKRRTFAGSPNKQTESRPSPKLQQRPESGEPDVDGLQWNRSAGGRH